MPIKPIDFGSQAPVTPAAKPVSKGPAPIAFPPSPPAKPRVQELEFKVNPVTFALEAVPVQTAPAPKPQVAGPAPIQFTAPPVAPTSVRSQPRAAFGATAHPAVAEVIERIKREHADIYRANEFKINSGVSSLIPLKEESILDWGTKALERVRDVANATNRLTKQFNDSNGTELCENVLKSLKATGIGAFFTKVVANPLNSLPQLNVQQTCLAQWNNEVNDLTVDAKKAHGKVGSMLIVINMVAEVVGTPSDNTLDRVLTQRRTLMNQSVMQAEFVVRQLDQLRQLIVDQRMTIDQLINVTIPAYKAANR